MIIRCACLFSLLAGVIGKGITVCDLKPDDLLKELYIIYKKHDFHGLADFPIRIFAPLSGPYFKKLSQIREPEAQHIADNGIPSPNSRPVAHYPTYPVLKVGQIVFLLVSFAFSL